MDHCTIIDIGTDADAGFWLAAFPFARFPIGDHAVRSAALSHCIACAESAHGGWVAGPCSWAGCELRCGVSADDFPVSHASENARD